MNAAPKPLNCLCCSPLLSYIAKAALHLRYSATTPARTLLHKRMLPDAELDRRGGVIADLFCEFGFLRLLDGESCVLPEPSGHPPSESRHSPSVAPPPAVTKSILSVFAVSPRPPGSLGPWAWPPRSPRRIGVFQAYFKALETARAAFQGRSLSLSLHKKDTQPLRRRAACNGEPL